MARDCWWVPRIWRSMSKMPERRSVRDGAGVLMEPDMM